MAKQAMSRKTAKVTTKAKETASIRVSPSEVESPHGPGNMENEQKRDSFRFNLKRNESSPATAPGAQRLCADRFDAGARARFFEHLALTANVAESARKANVSSSAVYRERRRSAAFRAAWLRALTEGYVRLEAEMLSQALIAAKGSTTEATLKSRSQKYRLGLALLTAHRASVRGEGVKAPKKRGLSTAQKRIEARFIEMRNRLKSAEASC